MLFLDSEDMAQAEELEQIRKWLSKEGLTPASSIEDQLGLLWRSFLHARSCLDRVTKELETNRLQHFAEMADVRKSLEQIKIFTEQKAILAQEIQDENEQLRKQLLHLVSLQDAQINEVAKMLYQQGLTELIHSSPSEQVAYLLVERASLLETSQAPGEQSRDGDAERAHAEPLNPSTCSGGETLSSGQARRLEKECSRLERDVEEGSRRLAMAHNEIRRLKDELESAHFTQKAYEPELQSAQEEVEQLRKEVEKLKQYEIVELRKAKELNERLDLEIRGLRNRVWSLDAEKNSLKKTTEGAETIKDNKSHIFLQDQLTAKMQQPMENKKESVECLQEVMRQLELAIQRIQGYYSVQKCQANELTKFQTTDVVQVDETCRDDQNNCLLQKRSEKQCFPPSENSHKHMNNLTNAKVTSEQQEFTCRTKELLTPLLLGGFACKEGCGCLEAREALLYGQAAWETLKKQICEILNCIDEERSKHHNMKEKLMEKLRRAKQRLDGETLWRDNRIKDLERELSLCFLSLTKEKEIVQCLTVENEKLLSERRKLLQQLMEEEDNTKNIKLTACLSEKRLEYLELENKNLGNKVLQTSNQISILERKLQNKNLLDFAEELQKMSVHQQKCTPLSVQTARLMLSGLQDLLSSSHSSDTKQAALTSSSGFCSSSATSQTAELGYLNLTSKQSLSAKSNPQSALSSSENTTS